MRSLNSQYQNYHRNSPPSPDLLYISELIGEVFVYRFIVSRYKELQEKQSLTNFRFSFCEISVQIYNIPSQRFDHKFVPPAIC